MNDWATESLHQGQMRIEAEPPFEAPEEQLRVWGRAWGASDEVGPLRSVLMRRPRDEWARVRTDCWDDDAAALVDPDGMWYWESRDPPDLAKVHEQHSGLVAALEAEGVEVVYVEGELPPPVAADLHARPAADRPGRRRRGADGPGDAPRRGAAGHGTLGRIGMPILRTIVGTGMLEGGSFVKLRPTVAAYGTSIRCNEEGARQLEETLRGSGSSSSSSRCAATRSTSTGTSGWSTSTRRWSIPGPPGVVSRAARRAGYRGDPVPGGGGMGDQLAGGQARSGADVRGVPANARAARAPRRRGRGDSLRRGSEGRRRRALLHDGARPRLRLSQPDRMTPSGRFVASPRSIRSRALIAAVQLQPPSASSLARSFRAASLWAFAASGAAWLAAAGGDGVDRLSAAAGQSDERGGRKDAAPHEARADPALADPPDGLRREREQEAEDDHHGRDRHSRRPASEAQARVEEDRVRHLILDQEARDHHLVDRDHERDDQRGEERG